MKTVTLKIEDTLFDETEKILSKIGISRKTYLNEALASYNKVQKRQILETCLEKESILVRKNSMNTLYDFENC